MNPPYRVYPSLFSCMKFSAITLGTIFGIMVVIGGVNELMDGHIPSVVTAEAALLGLALFVGLPLVLALFLYSILRFCAWSIGSNGVSGRTFWGFRVNIPWDDFGNIGLANSSGIPALLLTSASKKSTIWAYTLNVDAAEMHKRLSYLAGRDHVLTRSFGPAT